MDNESRKPLTQRGRFWLDHIRQWQATEDGPTHYCRSHSLSVSAFTWWRRQLCEQGWVPWTKPRRPGPFVELPRWGLDSASGSGEHCYEVLLPNQKRLRIPMASFDADQIKALVSVLESPC